MRRWIVCLLAALIAMSGACAAASPAVEPEGALAEVDPETGEVTYPYWMDRTDGSEMLVFMMIDAMNDEAKLVEEHGSLTIRIDHIGPDGEVYLTAYETLFDSEFGKGVLVRMDGYGESVYIFADRGAMLNEGRAIAAKPPFSPKAFEAVWASEGYYASGEEVLHAMAPAADGFTYMRTSGTYQGEMSGEFEYKLSDGMRIHSGKFYALGEDGELALRIVFAYSVGDPVEIPAHVADVLRQYEEGSAAEMPIELPAHTVKMIEALQKAR